MLNLIENLAQRIDERWKKADYSVYQFSEIAFEEMKKEDLPGVFDFGVINKLLDESRIKNVQIASDFSELHFKLFDNGKFYIEILNWWDKDTSIHDHGFAGVLVQLQGTALNALYSFANEDTSTSQTLRFGNVKLVGPEVSKKGNIRVIPYGRAEKHAVLHIAQPTISLIVRTHPVEDISPQLNYFAPYVMSNHSATGIAFNKRVKYFKILALMKNGSFRSEILHCLNNSSLTDSFWLLLKLGNALFKPENIEVLQEWVKTAGTEEIKTMREKVVASVACRRASQFIIDNVKPHFADEETRMFLAAIATSYNLSERALMFRELGLEFSENRLKEIQAKLSPTIASEFARAVSLLGNQWNGMVK